MCRQRCLLFLCLKNELTGPKLRTVKFCFPEYPHSSLSHLISLYKLKNDSQCESFCVVELELTGPTSTSQNIRTTRSESLAFFWSSDSALTVRSRILNLVEFASQKSRSLASHSSLLMFFSSLVIQEHLISLYK